MKKLILHPALLTLLLFGCSRDAHARIEHVERVFMHDDDEFSFMVRDPATGTSRTRKVYAEDVTFVRDVAPDKEMWAEFRSTSGCEFNDGDNASLVIHLHGTAEVEGAGWERRSGKTTTNGATQVVE